MMSRWSGFIIMVLAILVAVIYQMASTVTPQSAVYPINRTIKYSFAVKNPTNRPVKNAHFWLYAPLKQGVYQILEDVETIDSYKMESDEYGNTRLLFKLEYLPPFAQKNITVTANLRLSDSPNVISSINELEYLAEETFIELNDPKVKQLAQRLKGKSDRMAVENIYRWVTTNIEKTGYVLRNQGALQTLSTKTGDCTNTMYLFSALSRSNGIPTRNMAGFTTTENAVLRPRNYHNWLEVFVDGQWWVVDPDKEVFMDRATDYIVMTVLKDSPSLESQHSQHLFGGSDNIEITMN
jgi:transglutaminase-like putative cysteine protease